MGVAGSLLRVGLAATALAVGAFAAEEAALQELLLAVARGPASLRELLRRPGGPRGATLSRRDDHGFSALAVAAYNGDAEAVQLLLDAGARVTPGEITVFMSGESGAPVGSIVELLVRRSSMLIMLGTGFQLPASLREARRSLATSRRPSVGDAEVPDVPRTLELLAQLGGARPTEKSLEEGGDLARAAYFLDAGCVEVLVRLQSSIQEAGSVDDEAAEGAGYSLGASRALAATMLGISQMKHRLNRALLQQPRMAGRMFRDYYGFDVSAEEELTSPGFQSISFEDTIRTVQGKASRILHSLLEGRANPSYSQSRQSRKTPLHNCAEHGLTSLAESLLEARANPAARSRPLDRTPLHTAVIHRSAGVLRALLAARADPMARDVSGRSALELAQILRWVGGQTLLGIPSSSLAPPHGLPDVLAIPELLPQAWHARWQRGDMGQRWTDSGLDCEIDVVSADELTPGRFFTEFLSLRRPALVRGGAAHMQALERWPNLRYLTRKAGSTEMDAVTIPYPHDFGDRDAQDSRKVTLQEYVSNVMGRVNSSSGTPLYVFSVVEREQKSFRKLLALVERDAAPHPPWLLDHTESKLRLRFGNIQFGLGPAGSGAPQHYHTHAYASLFSGRKRWWFSPPPRSALSREHALRFAAADAARRSALGPAPPGREAVVRETLPLVCEQRPGDIVYVPTDWGHLTLNTETSVSVSREFTWDGDETDSYFINSLQL